MTTELVVGRRTILYTEAVERDADGDGRIDRTAYYDGEQLLATAYDDDGDGSPEIWVSFDADLRVDQEVVDRNADGIGDVVRTLDAAGRVADESPLVSEASSAPPPPAPPVEIATTEPPAPRPPFPLDLRLGIGVGIVLVSALLAGLALRR